MLDTYRKKGDAADPETFVAGIAATLCLYPPEVVQRVTDPRTGIVSRLKWIPEIAEIREACEAEMAPVRREQERQAQLAKQRERSEEWERERARVAADPADNAVKRYLDARKLETATMTETEKEARRKQLAHIETADRKLFERECAQAGLKSDGPIPISPSLIAVVKAWKAQDDEIEAAGLTIPG